MKECNVIDLTIHENEERCEENSEILEANVHSKEFESNVDELQMQENEINDHLAVIPNPKCSTNDPNPLLNYSNNVTMQHEIPSQVDITCNTLKLSSRTPRKIPRERREEVKRDLIKKLRNKISLFKKSLENIKKLVGKENLLLLRKEKRMKDVMSSVKLLSKFVYGVMRTEEKKSRIRLDKKPIVFNKPDKRKVLKLQK